MYIYIHVYLYMYACMYVHMYVCMYVCMHVYLYTYVYINIYIYMYSGMYTGIRAYTIHGLKLLRIYIYTHTYIKYIYTYRDPIMFRRCWMACKTSHFKPQAVCIVHYICCLVNGSSCIDTCRYVDAWTCNIQIISIYMYIHTQIHICAQCRLIDVYIYIHDTCDPCDSISSYYV